MLFDKRKRPREESLKAQAFRPTKDATNGRVGKFRTFESLGVGKQMSSSWHFQKKKKKLKIKLNTNFCAQAIPIAFDFRLPPEVRIYVDFFAATWAICQLVKSLVHEGLTGGLTI